MWRTLAEPAIHSQPAHKPTSKPKATLMLNFSRGFSLPPLGLALPEKLEDALTQCAHGESPPEIALMQLLIVSPSEERGERALGTAIWEALENHEGQTAERLGAIHRLWEGARKMVQTALR